MSFSDLLKKKISFSNFILVFIVLFLFFDILVTIYSPSFKSIANTGFGFLDYQSHWQSTADLAKGKIIYRDFFWEYGLLTLIIRLPLHFLLGGTFYSALLNDFFVLPLMAMIMCFIIGREFINKIGLGILLILAYIYGIYDFNGVRYLIPALGLVLSVVGIEQKSRSKMIIGSIFLGLSIISALEYAIVVYLSLFIYFIILYFTNKKELNLHTFLNTLFFPTIMFLSFLLFLISSHTLSNYITFHLSYAKTFYWASGHYDAWFPPRSLNLQYNPSDPFSSKNTLLNLFLYLRRLNLYIVPLVAIILIAISIIYRRKRLFITLVPLLCFSLFAYYRALNTPTMLNYGLFFVFLVPIILLFFKKLQWFMAFIILWFFISSINLTLGKLNSLTKSFSLIKEPSKLQQEYVPVAGISLRKDLAEEYIQIRDYIKKNTSEQDYVLSYRLGPYNLIANRKSPINVSTSYYYEVVPELTEETHKLLKSNSPKLIILNLYNGFSLESSIHGLYSGFYSDKDNNVYIEGLRTKIDDYIEDNYIIDKKYNIAWILRKKPKKGSKRLFIQAPDLEKWSLNIEGLQPIPNSDTNIISLDVIHSKPVIILSSKTINSGRIKIPIKVDITTPKILSKYVVRVFLGTTDNKLYALNPVFASSDWQNIWVNVPEVNDQTKFTNIILTISENYGFLPFGRPINIQIQLPQQFIINSAVKLQNSKSL